MSLCSPRHLSSILQDVKNIIITNFNTSTFDILRQQCILQPASCSLMFYKKLKTNNHHCSFCLFTARLYYSTIFGTFFLTFSEGFPFSLVKWRATASFRSITAFSRAVAASANAIPCVFFFSLARCFFSRLSDRVARSRL